MRQAYPFWAAVILSIGLTMGCDTGKSTDDGPSRVIAASEEGGSLLQVIGEIEQELDRLEQEKEGLSRQPSLAEDRVFDFDLSTAPYKGSDNPKLTMVVFSDLECPFCARFGETAHKLAEEFSNDLRLVFMNFPLHNDCNPGVSRAFHKKACIGAEAAMAANTQGKFWEMHDFLFKNRNTFSTESIVNFAKSQGMDAGAIKDAIENQKYNSIIKEQARQMLPTGSRGTPTVFINGMRAQNVRWDDYQGASAFIRELLNPEKTEAVETVAPELADTSALPTAEVFLDDGTRLDKRLELLKKRLSEIQLSRQKQAAPQKPKKPDPSKKYDFNISKSPVRGPDRAPVTITVFSDFMCPHSANMFSTLKELQAEYPNDLRVIYKNFPNPRHKFSVESHEAAAAAQAQGKFWEMHDRIFENRTQINPEFLKKLAQDIGFDMKKFQEETDSHKHRKMLIDDLTEATRANVTETPAVFINGKYEPNNRKEAIQADIKKILENEGN